MLIKLLCLVGIHLQVKDFFVIEHGVGELGKKTLVRQCMTCGKIINKPYFLNH